LSGAGDRKLLIQTYCPIWHLIDQGAADLDAPVRTNVPDLRLADEGTAARVTISNLLEHSAG
jgi:CubicO group peptidase (beta-lactamase class C family)